MERCFRTGCFRVREGGGATWLAPWPLKGVMACAASPSSTTRDLPHGAAVRHDRPRAALVAPKQFLPACQ